MTILDNVKLTYKHIGLVTDKNHNMHNMNQYKVTLKYNGKKMIVDYYIGLGLTEENINAKAVIYSLTCDDVSNMCFDEFCREYGYDNDSRKDLKTYKLCQKNTDKLYNMFSDSELSELRELLEDY